MVHFPVLVPIKCHSSRCDGKNGILLPYTLEYLRNIGRINDCVIISDTMLFKSISDSYDIKEYYLEEREECQDEIVSLYNYVYGRDIGSFIFLPVTQPLREVGLIDKMIGSSYGDYDMVVSYIASKDREIFRLNGSGDCFAVGNIERKGSKCGDISFADGACYLLSKDYIVKVMDSDNPNKVFWGGNILYIENSVPFLDVDTFSDMRKFFNLCDLFSIYSSVGNGV